MTAWNDSLSQVLTAIRIEAPHELTFAGRKFTVQPEINGTNGANGGNGANGTPKVPLVELLTGALYRYVYSRPFKPPLPPVPEGEQPEEYVVDPALSALLSAANASRDRWEHGWTIAQIHSGGQITAQRGAGGNGGATSRSLWPGQFLSKDGPGARPRVGAQISIFYPRESTSLQSGFYYCFGETPEDESFALGLVRFYWNIGLAGAPELVRALSARLNAFQVPFRFKCSVMPTQYDRTDVAVVYLAKRLFPFVADLLQEVHAAVRPHLGPEVPFFTWRLAPGIGVAEDPGTGESFGQHRSRLLAEACWSCYLRGDQETASRLDELRRLAAAQNTDPDRFHLNAGSLDCYEAPAWS